MDLRHHGPRLAVARAEERAAAVSGPVGGHVPRDAVARFRSPEQPPFVFDVARLAPCDAIRARCQRGGIGNRAPTSIRQHVQKQPSFDLPERRVAILPLRVAELRHLLPRVRIARAPQEHAAAARTRVMWGRLMCEIEPAVEERQVGVGVVGAVRDGVPRLDDDASVDAGDARPQGGPRGPAARLIRGAERASP